MERLPTTEPQETTSAEQLALSFGKLIPFATTREAQATLVQQFTLMARYIDADIDFNTLLPPQVIDEI